jgi:hypothetical protein
MAKTPAPDVAAPVVPDMPADELAAAPVAPMAIPPEMLAVVQAMAQSIASSMVAAQTAGATAISQMHGPRDNPMGSPLISSLNPLGERDHPRPEFHCPTLFCGMEQEREACSADEITMLNLIEPGRYRVQKTDGSLAVMTVYPEIDSASERMVKKHIVLPGMKDQTGLGRQNWPGMLVLLAQAMGFELPRPIVPDDRPLGKIQGPSGSVGLPTAGAMSGRFGVSLDGSAEGFLAAEHNPMIRRDVSAMLSREVA